MERIRKLRKAKPYVKLTYSSEVERRKVKETKSERIMIVTCFLKRGVVFQEGYDRLHY